MGFYRKKPVVIEAKQLQFQDIGLIQNWIELNGGSVLLYSEPPFRQVTGLTIRTLEGNMKADFGDWIIKGINGEFYPCKDEIFQKTYEEAEDESHP